MPWKASSVMEERLRFVACLLDGEAMTDVGRDFGVGLDLTAATLLGAGDRRTAWLRARDRSVPRGAGAPERKGSSRLVSMLSVCGSLTDRRSG